jgi:hypothetical protein
MEKLDTSGVSGSNGFTVTFLQSGGHMRTASLHRDDA